MKVLYTYFAACLLIVVFHSCKKELGALPKNEKVDANTILDQATAQISLNGVYSCFANATNLKTGWQDHEVFPSRLAGNLTFGSSTTDEDLNFNARIQSYYWSESYILLNAANGVLKGINNLSDAKFVGNRKKEMIAEAHFLRAYGHFKLLIYYAEWYKVDSPYGVLLRDELSTLSNIPKARSTVKGSYDFILADLDDAIANAPTSNPNYYVNKWAAMALKMRVLMSRGTSNDYIQIVNLANTITQSNTYTLEAKAEDIFHKSGLSSKEIILGIKPQPLQEKDYYSKSAQYWPGASSLYVATSALKDLFNNDPRKAWMIGSANPDTSVPNTFYFTKYILENTTPTTVSESDYALRLTEVYLLKAEAIVRSGGNFADAKILVHTIQEKAGITATSNNTPYLAVENAATSASLLMEIYKEVVKSLMAEDGMEWMAMLRLPFETVKQLKPTITTQQQYILPIPKTEFQYNSLFGEQNPGYSKN